MKTVGLIFLSVLLITVLAPIAVTYFFGRSFIYHPTLTSREDVETLAKKPGWTLDRFATDVELIGLTRTPSAATARWLLFFGGNASSLEGNQHLLELVREDRDVGLSVFAYRGYDGSGGTPDASTIFEDAEKLARTLMVRHGLAADRLVIMGQSLGSGVATDLAVRLSKSNATPAALVLISPYRSMARVFDDIVPMIPVGWVVQDRFDTEAIIEGVRCPIHIVHGVEDRLIGIQHGRSLANRLGPRAQLVEIEGRGHNDLFADEKTLDAIRKVLR